MKGYCVCYLAIFIFVANASDSRVALVHGAWAGADGLVVHRLVVADPVHVAERTEQVAFWAVPIRMAKTIA